jgi:hypothetical protein
MRRLAIGAVLLLGVLAVVFWRAGASSGGAAKKGESTGGEKSTPEAAKPSPPALARPLSSAAPASTVTPSTAPVTKRRPAKPLSGPEQLAEASLMARLREARAGGNQSLAIDLAREGNRRFPDSTNAPERHSILIHALADAERRSEVRGEAEFMVNHYPDSDWVREIEGFTGAHRHRNVRLTDAGDLQYYDP